MTLATLLTMTLILPAQPPGAAAAPGAAPPSPPVAAHHRNPRDRAGYTSIHHYELARHRGAVPPRRRLPPASRLKRGTHKSVNRIVYGYYPFWLADLTTIRWEALTHLAWFSIELDAQGDVTATHGWPDTAAVSTAHAAGVRVDLAFTLFSGSGVLALCQDAARRATAIDNMVDLMEQGGADGIAVDFEGLVAGTRDPFTTFITELRAELDARGLATAEISIAGPAVDWNDNFDLPALLDQIDYFFIMGYDYFWSGSGYAGPTGILRVTPGWRHATAWSALRSIAHYTSLVPAHRRRQILYGVPYYGREWTTTSGDRGAATVSSVGSVTYSAARAAVEATHTRQWDPGTRTPWYAWSEGGSWHQVYYDDAESLGHKYQLALDEGLGGVGIWALNHDAPFPDLWDLLEERFGVEPPAPEGHRDNPIRIREYPFADSRDTAVGPSQYFNHYGCRPDLDEYGREWVYRVDVCQPGILAASVPEYPGNDPDPDLHLLSGPDQDACLDRAHTDLNVALQPGSYLLTVDTYVDDSIELEGPYELSVSFTPEAGTEGCAAHLVCEAGDCQCADPAHTDCGSLCADLDSDPAHCGACHAPCAANERCEAGQCVPDAPVPDASVSPDASDATELPCCPCPDRGCGCHAAAAGTDDGFGPFGAGLPLDAALPWLVLLWLWGLRRREIEG